jgi:hypothetical protein
MRLLIILGLLLASVAHAYKLHDAHLHYNESVWKRLPADQAIRFLVEHNIERAVFSSTPDKGTEMLYEIAPDRVIPLTRPYRSNHDVLTWHHNPEIVEYTRQQAAKGIFRGFGEFHMWFHHLDGKSIMPEIMQIAAEQGWVLNAHTDIKAMEKLLEMQPTVNIIWAHCGFLVPADKVQALIEKYPTAHCDMSFHEILTDEDDNLMPEWKALMEKHPDRFMVAVDTFSEGRWGELQKHTDFIQEWLAQLSPRAAKLIAHGNVSRLFPLEKSN